MTDKKANNSEFRPIPWEEVQAGDVLFHDNGDRVTVDRGGEVIVVAVGHELATDAWAHMGFTPYRRKPEMPTVPGAYVDKEGVLCVRQSEESAKGDIVWFMPESDVPIGLWQTSEEMEHRAPFTRLVPMPTEDAVHAAVYNALRGCAVDGMYQLRTINAVMALLRGDKQEVQS